MKSIYRIFISTVFFLLVVPALSINIVNSNYLYAQTCVHIGLVGDVDDNGAIEVTDGMKILQRLFIPGSLSFWCPENANVNGIDGDGPVGSENVGMADAIYLFNYLFISGPRPVDRVLYQVILLDDLDPGAEQETAVKDVNNTDEAVGEVKGPDGLFHAVVWRDRLSTPVNLNIEVNTAGLGDGYVESVGAGINNNGDIIGTVSRPFGAEGGRYQAYIYYKETGGSHILDGDGSIESYAHEINNMSQFIGMKTSRARVGLDAVRWDGEMPTLLEEYPEAGFTIINVDFGLGINDEGKSVGFSADFEPAFPFKPMLWERDGSRHVLPLAQGCNSQGYTWDINNNSMAVGSCCRVANPDDLIVDLQVGAGMAACDIINTDGTDFAVLALTYWDENRNAHFIGSDTETPYIKGEALAVNNNSQVVGYLGLVTEFEEQRAFFYDDTRGLINLNNVIGSSSGWVLNRAQGINDRGVIVGIGTLGGISRAFMLIPQ